MDFTNEINTLESEKLRLEEMLKRNNDRLQLLKEVSVLILTILYLIVL